MTSLRDRVLAEVEKIIDPETGLAFGEMKMIKEIKEIEPGVMEIDFIPSSPFCPIAFKLAMDIKKTAEKIDGVKKAIVNCRSHMMEEAINRMVNQEETTE